MKKPVKAGHIAVAFGGIIECILVKTGNGSNQKGQMATSSNIILSGIYKYFRNRKTELADACKW